MFKFYDRNSSVLPVIIILMLGIGVSMLVFILAMRGENYSIKNEFDHAAENRCTVLKREIESNFQILESLRAFYQHSETITRSEFSGFTAHFLKKNRSIQALAWIPRVPRSKRKIFEEDAKKDGLRDFQITELKSNSQTKTADPRETYFPAYFVEPSERNRIAIGFDESSEPVRRKFLEQARDTGEMAATGRINLVVRDTDQYGFLVFSPVYKKGAPVNSVEERRQNLRGYILGVFKISDIINKSITYLEPEGIDVYLYDASARMSDSFLYFHHPSEHKPASPVKKLLTGGSFDYVKSIDLAGRQWLIRYVADKDYIAGKASFLPPGILLAGLILTALLANYIRLGMKHSADLSNVNSKLIREIAERKQIEDEFRILNESLEVRIEERTSQLESMNLELKIEISERVKLNQLLHARASELECAYRDIELFSYAASHDLRAPLIPVEAFSRILLQDYSGKLDEKGRDYLARINEGARKMTQLINDLLAFSRVSGREVCKSCIDMEPLIRKLYDELRPVAGKRDIRLEIGSLPAAYGDPAMLTQVLANYLSNAIKFTATREKALIEFGAFEVKNENVYYVRDNGIGFDMENIDRLFGLFQRLHSTKKFEGTGIGLLIARKIIEKHGGEVWAEGAPDSGAVFYFALPKTSGG